MYDLFCKCRCVYLNFSCSSCLTVDVKNIPCHSACIELKFVHTFSLRLNAFFLPWQCLKPTVVRACSLRMDLFPLICLSRCVMVLFAYTSSVRLDVFFLPCHTSCVQFNFVHICKLRLNIFPLMSLWVWWTRFCECLHFKTDVFRLPLLLYKQS